MIGMFCLHPIIPHHNYNTSTASQLVPHLNNTTFQEYHIYWVNLFGIPHLKLRPFYLSYSRFYLIDSITQMTRTFHWLSKYSKNYENVAITDVTSQYSGLSVIGPESTQLLQSITQTSLDLEDFPCDSVKVAV